MRIGCDSIIAPHTEQTCSQTNLIKKHIYALCKVICYLNIILYMYVLYMCACVWNISIQNNHTYVIEW